MINKGVNKMFNINNLAPVNAFDINRLQPTPIAVDYTGGMYVVILNGVRKEFADYGSAKEVIEQSMVA